MPHYEVVRHTVEPVEGDDQVAVVIHASDGNKWEYGIPFNRSTGRYQFSEIDVLEADFGEDFARQLADEVEALVARLCG
jgi:hypothetical protein